MNAGRLNRRVTLQQKSVTRDALGAEVVTWVDVATVWAEVSPYSGREFVALRQAQDEITTRITIRYRRGVTPAMRVVHGEAKYDIVHVIDRNDAHVSLELVARAEAVPS